MCRLRTEKRSMAAHERQERGSWPDSAGGFRHFGAVCGVVHERFLVIPAEATPSVPASLRGPQRCTIRTSAGLAWSEVPKEAVTVETMEVNDAGRRDTPSP
jgi:hypothetical protein